MKSRKKLGERRRGGWKCEGGRKRKKGEGWGEGEGENEEEEKEKEEGGGKKWEGGKRGGKV